MTTRSAQQHALAQLKMLYDEREAANIADWVMEHVTGRKRTDRLLDKDQALDESLLNRLQNILQELTAHRPVQYVLGEAWFAGMRFYVNEHVLIPRPETEELVDWIVAEIQKSQIKNQNILDIGTGSGCIPIALKKKLPSCNVTSLDISSNALAVAQKNANDLQATIELACMDFLDESNWHKLSVVDIIVSNPPYIRWAEQEGMAKNVVDFEPPLALFVPNDDPLIFYRKIADFAKTHLHEQGNIFLEINEALGKVVVELYAGFGYRCELKKDLQGRDRMIKAKF
jgi:release factor glutamine methyltransferase